MSTQGIHNYDEINIKQGLEFNFTRQSSDARAKTKRKLVRLEKILKDIKKKRVERSWYSEVY